MKVLVIDDESGKREQIVAFVAKLEGITLVDEARSFQSAMERLGAASYDFVVLDMRLTSFDVTGVDDGGRPRNFGGDEVLRKLTRRGVAARVAVLTQYTIFRDETGFLSLDQLASQFAGRYPSFAGLVQFQHSNTGWQDKLRTLIEETPR